MADMDKDKADVGILTSNGHPGSASLDSCSADEGTVLSPVDESKLLRKIDFRVLPILFIVYVASFIDRQASRPPLTSTLSLANSLQR